MHKQSFQPTLDQRCMKSIKGDALSTYSTFSIKQCNLTYKPSFYSSFQLLLPRKHTHQMNVSVTDMVAFVSIIKLITDLGSG